MYKQVILCCLRQKILLAVTIDVVYAMTAVKPRVTFPRASDHYTATAEDGTGSAYARWSSEWERLCAGAERYDAFVDITPTGADASDDALRRRRKKEQAYLRRMEQAASAAALARPRSQAMQQTVVTFAGVPALDPLPMRASDDTDVCGTKGVATAPTGATAPVQGGSPGLRPTIRSAFLKRLAHMV